MNARPQPRQAEETSLANMVDQLLSRSLSEGVAHPEDWPLPSLGDTGLPRSVWERALGDIASDILTRPSRQFRARLCTLGWRLGDGPGEIPVLLPFLVEVIHAGSLIVDDIEDGSTSRRGGPCLHRLHSVPVALNAGTWMYFWATELLDQLPLPAGLAHGAHLRHELRATVLRTLYRCHMGQALDLSVSVGDLPQEAVTRTVATSTMLKTGALMELAARLGSMAAGASATRVEALARFGRRLGLGLQMLDDFGNLNAPSTDAVDSKALEDLRHARPTWPWAFAARELDEPTFAHLQASVRALVNGADADGTRARALAAELRMAVGLKGRRQTNAYLQTALRDLRAEVGARDEIDLLTKEIQRLEAAYG